MLSFSQRGVFTHFGADKDGKVIEDDKEHVTSAYIQDPEIGHFLANAVLLTPDQHDDEKLTVARDRILQKLMRATSYRIGDEYIQAFDLCLL